MEGVQSNSKLADISPAEPLSSGLAHRGAFVRLAEIQNAHTYGYTPQPWAAPAEETLRRYRDESRVRASRYYAAHADIIRQRRRDRYRRQRDFMFPRPAGWAQDSA